jgi:hypothetical protein
LDENSTGIADISIENWTSRAFAAQRQLILTFRAV